MMMMMIVREFTVSGDDDDINGYQQGVGWMDMSIHKRDDNNNVIW